MSAPFSDGLDAERATALADRLDIEIKEGHCERYARVFCSEQEMDRMRRAICARARVRENQCLSVAQAI
jgi:hypothetical protein